jgi:cysteinyl-tRNA synthetase
MHIVTPARVFDRAAPPAELHPQVVYACNITDVDDKINEAPGSVQLPRFRPGTRTPTTRTGGSGAPPTIEPGPLRTGRWSARSSGHEAGRAEGHVLFDVEARRLRLPVGRDLREMIAGARRDRAV